MSKKAIIDVGLRIDVKDQLDAIASEIQSMAKSSSKGISSSMAKEMQAIEDEVNKIKETMNNLAFGKLNARAFDSTNRALMTQIDNLEKRTSTLEDEMKALINTMSESDGGKMTENLNSVSKAMENLRDNAQNTVSGIQEIQKAIKNSGSEVNFVDTTKDIEALKEERAILKDIKDTVSDFDKGKLSFDLDLKNKDFKEAEKEVNAILKRMVQLNTQVKTFGEINTDEQRKEYASLQRELAKTTLMLSDAAAKIDREFGSKLGPENSVFRKVLGLEDDEIFTKKIDSIINYITKRSEAITTKLADLGSTNVLSRNEKGSIEVPLELTPKGKGLATQAEHIIAVAQRTINNKPLEVQFKLVSAYSSKKTNTILKQFQAEIDSIEDELQREDFQGLFNQLRDDFQKEINIKVSADVKDVVEKVNTTVKKIREELKEKISVFPTIQFEDEELKKIQGILDNISKSLTLTIGDVALSEKATKKLKAAVENQKESKIKKKTNAADAEEMAKIKELSKSIEAVTEGINGQLNEINSGSLQPIISSLQQIGQLLVVIMQSSSTVPESITGITSNIQEMITVLQRGFGFLTNDELDTRFANIQDRISKINGDLRGGDKNKRVQELKELIKLYKEYQDLGGKKTIEDLGGAKNVQKWLQSHVNDDIFSAEALGLNKVEESVDDISKKVDAKNEKFKEEAEIVKSVASEETKALKDVVDVLQQIFTNIAIINDKGFDSFKTEDWRQGITDALKAIDDLELQGKNGEKLDSLKVKVEPLIDPVEFSNEVSNALSSVTAEIKVSPSFDSNEFKNEIEKYINSDNATKEIEQLTEDFLELSEAEAHLAQSGDLGIISGSQFVGKTNEELKECLANEEKWLARCKEGSDRYKERKANIEEINNLLHQSSVESGAIESSQASKEESNAFSQIAKEAKEASEEKEKFAKANAEVLSSITESVKGLADESGAFDSLNKLVKNLGKQEGMDKTIKNLQAIADLLKTEVSDSSILSVLKDIAAQGTDLGDIATLIKASRKEIERAKKAVDKAEGKDKGGPTIVHNGVLPFIEKGSSDWKFINEQVEKHKEELGEVLNIYRKVDGELESFTVKTTKGNTMIFGKDSEDQWIASIQRIQDFKDQYKESLKLVKSLQGASGIGGFIDKQQTKIDNKVDRERVQYTKEYLEELDKAEAKLNELNAILQKNEGIDIWDQEDIDNAKKLQEEIKKITDGLTKSSNQAVDNSAIDKLLTKINTDLKDNTKMTPELRNRFLMLRNAVDEFRDSAEGASKVDFKPLTAEFQHLHEQMLRTGQTGKSFFQSIAEAAKSQTTQFIARYFSLQDWIRYAQQGFEKVKSIDSALTELRKVSDASTSRLAQNFEASSKAAQDLGHSISGVINITADWARLGYSVDDAEKLARITTMFETVGDNMSTETASQYMISTLQGFQLGVDKAEEITDKYNEVANNFAIDTAGIGEALTRSAASFNAANTDLSQAIALVTATNEVVQNPESVGTLWKTLSARIRGASTELQELNEEEDQFTQTTSKLRDLVKSLTGFDIMKDEDTYKSIYDIILGIGENWDKLTDIEQASLGEALAGKRNANALFAVLGNLDTLRGAYEKAEDSAGSAAKEQENYQKSLQYSLDRTKASLEELSYDLLDSDMLKEGLELINEIIKAIDMLVQHLNPLSASLAALGIGGGVHIAKNFGRFESLGIFQTLMSTASTYIDADLTSVADALLNLDNEQRAAFLSATQLSEAGRVLAMDEAGLDQSTQALVSSLMRQNTTLGESVPITTRVSNAYRGLAASLGITTTALGVLIGSLVAVGAAVAFIVKTDQAIDDMRESSSQFAKDFVDSKKEIEDYKAEIQSLQATIADSNSTYEESKSARERLYEIQSTLIQSYGTEAGQIDLVTQAIEGEISALDELSRKQWNKQLADFNQTGFWEKAGLKREGVKSKEELMLKQMEQYTNGNALSLGAALDKDTKRVFEELSRLYGLTLSRSENTDYLSISGNADEVVSKLIEIQSYIKEKGYEDIIDPDFNDMLARYIEDIGKISNEWSDFYHQYNLNERLLKDSDYKKLYEEYSNEYEKYTEAVTDANEEGIESQFNKITDVRKRLLKELDSDSSISQSTKDAILAQFDDLAPEIENKLKQQKLEIDLNNSDIKVNGIDRTIDQVLKQVANSFEYTEDVLNYENGTGLQYQQTAYERLITLAGQYDVSLEYLIGLLKERNYLESRADTEFLNRQQSRLYAFADALGYTKDEIDEFTKDFTFEDWSDLQGLEDNLANFEKYRDALEAYKESAQSVKDKGLSVDEVLFGNIDLSDSGRKLVWTQENVDKYRRALESWGSNPDDYLGSFSTVDAGSTNINGIEIAFTPMLRTKEGIEYLDSDSVYNYLEQLVDKSKEVDGSDLIDLDAEGLIVNGKEIKGLIADIGETARDTAENMHEIDAYRYATEDLKAAAESFESINLPSFDEAIAGAKSFMNGTEDVASELETLQTVLSNTKNVGQEAYAALLQSSDKYSNALVSQNGRLGLNRNRLLATANARVKEQRQTLRQVTAYKKLEYLKLYKELKLYDAALADTTSEDYKHAMALQEEITQLDMLSNSLEQATDMFARFKEAQETANSPDYDTAKSAYDVVKEALQSGQVGTDDFEAAQRLLMSNSDYKKFMELTTYDEKYDFMSKLSKDTAQFFTDDQAKNAKNFLDALEKAGLVEDGILHSSQEIGEQLHLSHDAVNALVEDVNLFGFGGEVIRQSPVDVIDQATEALTNYTSAQEALNQAQEDGADQKYILALSEDLDKAKERWDALAESLPRTMQEAEEAAAKSGKSILESLFNVEDNEELTQTQEANILAFVATMSTRVEELKSLFGSTNEEAMILQETVAKVAQAQYDQRADGIANRQQRIADAMKQYEKAQQALTEGKSSLAYAGNIGEGYKIIDLDQLEADVNTAEGLIEDLTSGQHLIDLQLDQSTIQNQIDSLKQQLEGLDTVNVTQKQGFGSGAALQAQAKGIQSQIDKLEKENAEINTILNFIPEADEANAVKSDLEEPITTNVTFNPLTTKIDAFIARLKQLETNPITISFASDTSNFSVPSGMGNDSRYFANGTAHADGQWGLPHDEKGSIDGELGVEGLVRDGKFYLIGKNGPERRDFKKGDIIFNHRQTEDLLKKGYATGRGTLIGSGLVDGSIANAHSDNKLNVVTQNVNFDKFMSKDVSKAAKQATEDIKDDIDEVEKESEEQTDNFIDWIERRIKHFSTYAERYLNQAQKALDKVTNTLYSGGQKGVKAFKVFDKTIDSLYKTASNSQRDFMEVQQEAYTAYTNLTNAVGLDPEYQNRIKYGLMEIENVTDETLKDQISKYQDYYDKSQEALDNFIEAAEKFYHLPIDKAAEKIENLSNKIEYLGKVSDNTIGYKNKNEILKEQDKQQRLTYKAQKQANKETQKNLKAAKKQAKKETKDQINDQIKKSNAKLKQEKAEVKSKKALASADKAAKKEIKQATKSNKAIDLSKLQKGTKAYKEAKQYNAALTDKANSKLSKKELKTGNVLNLENFEEGSAAYKAVVKYNAAINAQTEAWNNAKNAEEEYLHWHQVEYPKAAFDNIANDFNHTVEMMNHDFTDYSNQINELIKAGKKVSTGYYRAQKDINALKMEEYIMERNELETQLSQIQRYSDEWYDAYNQIKEVDNQISQLKISTMELNEAMRQLYLDSFQGMRNDIETLIGEQEFLLSLMSHNKKTDNEIGYFTDEGLVNLTSGVATATMSQAKQRNTASEIKELQDLLDKGELKWKDTQFESIDQLKDQIRELYGTWQSEIKDTYDAQSSIVDLMKERYQAELEMYKDLVSSKKEALSAEKDLYDYQKKIAEKTKNIALLEKQLAAYAGDSSQEGQARRQKLQKDITNAKDDLRDTEYDKYIQDQQKMLDDLIGEYEERIEKKLEDFNGLLAEGITISGKQAKNTKEVLNQLASNNGYIPLKMNDFNANLKAEQEQLTAFDQYFKDVFGSGDTGKLASLVTNSNEILSSLGNGDVVNAITGINAESAFVKAIIDANSVDTQEITDAIKTIGGKTATENAEGNDPVAQAKKEQAAKEAVSSVAPAVSTASTIADIQTALTSVSAGTVTAKSSINNEADIKKQANDFIKKNAKAGRANKNGKDFGPVNKQIAKFMGTEGKPLDKMKVLTTAELDDLAKMIGLKNRKDSNFEKKLKELHIAGFAHGGLVEAIKRNGDDGIATLKVGEAILTPTDSKNLASLAQKFEAIDVTADIMNMLKETARDTSGLGTPQNIDYGGVQFNFELPNVTDSKSFINAIQSDSNLQKAIQSVSVDRINNGGRLSVNRIR